jgi:molybdenum cofactor cytidylyltransferase
MKLHQAFEVVRGDVVAFVGAGGKTAALVGLGYELLDLGWRVLATSTCPMPLEQLHLFPHAMPYQAKPQDISDALSEHGFVLLYESIEGQRVYPPTIDSIKDFVDTVDSDVFLVEADYAEGLPLKAPFEYEPKIPHDASLVVPIVSLSAVDKPLNNQHIYNAEAIIEKFGFIENAEIRSPWLAQVLRDDEMGLRAVPQAARIVPFVNQTPFEGYKRGRARLVAQLTLKSPRIRKVALGAVRAADPVYEMQAAVAAVVLAAGTASRMGEAKLLLPWANGKNILEHILEQLIRARLDEMIVVTGHYADEVKAIAKAMGASPVHNKAYKTGEMLSSLKTGLRAMPEHISAAFIVLGDQPRIQPKLLYRLLNAYAEGKGEIIAPSYQMRRGHPILISRNYWQEFLDLRGNQSPRDVFNAHASEIHYVEAENDGILRDVDTPQDYEDERFRAGLGRYKRPS